MSLEGPRERCGQARRYLAFGVVFYEMVIGSGSSMANRLAMFLLAC